MKIIISKELKKFMRYAKKITEIEDKETGFYIHIFNLPGMNDFDPYDTFHSELIIGDNKGIYLHSKYKRLTKSLDGKIIICGSFHTHSHKKYLANYESAKNAGDRLVYNKDYCRNYLSSGDFGTVLSGIMKGGTSERITCVLSDTEDRVSYFIPKKCVSIDEFALVYDRFRRDKKHLTLTETADLQKDSFTVLIQEHRKTYRHIFDIFDKGMFSLNSDETIIEI